MNENTKISMRTGDLEITVEGNQEFVEEKFSELLKKMQELPTQQRSDKETVDVSPSSGNEGEMTLAEFARRKKPKGNPQSAVVYGYYIQQIQGQEFFTNREIKSCYTELGRAKPSNLAQDFKSAVRKGHLRSRGRSRWELTQTGQKFVESLPGDKSQEE